MTFDKQDLQELFKQMPEEAQIFAKACGFSHEQVIELLHKVYQRLLENIINIDQTADSGKFLIIYREYKATLNLVEALIDFLNDVKAV